MSVISIRPSSVALKGLSSAPLPNRMPHIPQNIVADKSIVPAAAGRLAQTIQQAGGHLLNAFLAYRSAENDRKLASAGADYQQRLQDGFLGAAGADYKQRLQEGFMQGGKPLMMREGDDLENIESDTENLFKTSFDAVCDKHGLTGELKERFRQHVAPVDLSWNGRMATHVAAERKKNEIAATERLVEKDEELWAQDRFNPDMTRKLLDDYDHKLKVKGFAEEVRAADVRKYALGLAADITLEKIGEFAKTDSDEAFAEHMRLLKEEPDGFWNDNEVLGAELGAKALNPKTVEGLVAEAKRQREQFLREKEREENDAVKKVLNAGIVAAHTVRDENGNYPADRLARVETALSDARDLAAKMPKESSAAANAAKAASELDSAADAIAKEEMLDEYMGMLESDPGKRIYDPGAKGLAANAYEGDPRKARLAREVQDAVDREREKAEKRSRQELKEVMDANENGLKTAWSQLTLLEAEGSIDDTEAAYAQSQIWRKLSLCTLAGTVSPEFSTSFRKAFSTRLDDEEKAAVLKLYRAFGYKGDVGPDGLATAKTQKADSTDYYVPQPEGASEDGRIKIGHEDMYRFVQEIRDTLRTLDPETDRKAAVEAAIRKAQVDWLKDGWFSKRIDENVASGVRAVMDYQREAKAAFSQRGGEEKETEKK